MSVIQRDERSFEVDLASLGGGGFWRRLRRAPVRVDPYLVAQALLAVMDHCKDRDVRGQRLIWNDYRIFLSQGDFDGLAPLAGGLERDLAAMLQERFQQGDASLVGALAVDLLVSEGERLTPGRIVVQAEYTPYASEIEGAGKGGSVTVRADRQVAKAPPSMPTRRVVDPGRPYGALRVRWRDQEVTVGMGVRVVLGRPHPDASGSFVPLHGAANEINRRQLFIEPGPDGGAIIGRLSGANAVQVNGRLVQPGGQIAVPQLPVEISLTNGSLLLKVEGAPMAESTSPSMPRAKGPS